MAMSLGCLDYDELVHPCSWRKVLSDGLWGFDGPVLWNGTS